MTCVPKLHIVRLLVSEEVFGKMTDRNLKPESISSLPTIDTCLGELRLETVIVVAKSYPPPWWTEVLSDGTIVLHGEPLRDAEVNG